MLGEVFPGLWVRGEIQRLRNSRPGHLYFELVEKGRGDQIVGKLDAVAWRTDHQRIRRQLDREGHRLAEGQEIRCWGGVDFWGPGGRLQFVVREIDPLFTLGHLERRRRETLDALRAAGLLELNGGLDLSPVPLSIGLVTSEGSAA
ncbi:MAG: exodeoxyribonuclease VII large subunit, partial [Acidobacteriota bacterium]